MQGCVLLANAWCIFSSFLSGLQHCLGEVHQRLSTLRGPISAEQDMSCMTHGHQWTYGQAFSEANMQLSSATPSVLVQHVATLAMWRGL